MSDKTQTNWEEFICHIFKHAVIYDTDTICSRLNNELTNKGADKISDDIRENIRNEVRKYVIKETVDYPINNAGTSHKNRMEIYRKYKELIMS